MKNADVGLIGLAVMGGNLARNIASKQYNVVVYNRTAQVTQGFIQQYGSNNLTAAYTLEELVASLKRPRQIIIMVKAGEPVDAVINQLLPLLEPEDMMIDCGNSFFRDTIRRTAILAEKNIYFVGCGVSGGEEGALHGPSIMPGGDGKAYKCIEPIFSAIAAKDFSGNPCVSHIGQDGAGHYIKMIHNAIEYGMMQIMAEAYEIFRSMYGLQADKISAIFAQLNKGKLNSYLFEITVEMLKKKDEFVADDFAINYILDRAEQKGTGKWTVQDALDRGVPLPTLTEAVFARAISAPLKLRVQMNAQYSSNNDTFAPARADLTLTQEKIQTIEQALYAAMITCYAQGFDLIHVAAREQNWQINLAEISRIWQGGCIIRARLLSDFQAAFIQTQFQDVHLYQIPFIQDSMQKAIPELRQLVAESTQQSIPIPCLSSALNYFDSITRAKLSANFIQGLRDFFGAHTYERIDREGKFHTKWNE